MWWRALARSIRFGECAKLFEHRVNDSHPRVVIDVEQRRVAALLDQLDQLITQVRHAGLPVEIRVEGDIRPLSSGLDLCLYRLIQEALTNALKHARGARARIDLRYAPRLLEIEVVDEGGSGRRDIGEQHVKNIPRPIHAYRLTPGGATPAVAALASIASMSPWVISSASASTAWRTCSTSATR